MDKKLVTNLALMLLATIILATEFALVANARINRPGGNFSSSVGVEGYSDPNCGKDAPGKRKCKHELCCSQWGFCGSTEEYCGDGCQSGYGAPCGHGDEGGDEPPSSAPPPCSCSTVAAAEYYSVLDDDESSSAVVDHGKYDDPNCGKGKGGGGKCDDGLCCSEFGFCGSRDEYCGVGCQHGYGRCHGGTPPGGGGGSPPPRHQKPPPHHNKPPPGHKKPPPHHRNPPPRGGGHNPPPRSRAPPPCTC